MTLRLNMSDKEASSEARSYVTLPTGEYLCNIITVSPEKVRPESNNAGKDYWNIQFVVQEGEYTGKSIYANVMLFEGALYAFKQLAASIFPEDVDLTDNTVVVREPQEYEGKQLIVTGIKLTAGSNIKRQGRIIGKRDRDTFEIKGYKPTGQANGKTSDRPDLLP